MTTNDGQRGDQRKSTDHTPGGKFAVGNSRAWRKGQSGNPKGRTPVVSFTAAIKRKLIEAEELAAKSIALKDGGGKYQRAPTMDEIAEAFLIMALMGNSTAASIMRELLDRLDGKVPARTLGEGDQEDVRDHRHTLDTIRGRLLGLAPGGDSGAAPTESLPDGSGEAPE